MLVLVAICSSCAREDVAGWGGDFETGEYPVGFRSIPIVAESPIGVPRQMTLSLWYPANADVQEPRVRVEDLFRIVVAEGQLSETNGLSVERGSCGGDDGRFHIDTD